MTNYPNDQGQPAAATPVYPVISEHGVNSSNPLPVEVIANGGVAGGPDNPLAVFTGQAISPLGPTWATGTITTTSVAQAVAPDIDVSGYNGMMFSCAADCYLSFNPSIPATVGTGSYSIKVVADTLFTLPPGAGGLLGTHGPTVVSVTAHAGYTAYFW